MARIFLSLAAILLYCCTCQGNNETVVKSSVLRLGALNNYYHYTRDNPRDADRIYATSASATATRTMRTKTVIVVHGHGGSAATSLNPTVKDALLTAEDVSVIVVDWSLVANMPYEVAVGSVPDVGSDIAELIRLFVSGRRITLNNLHLVGFGLGAHVVGFTARAVTTGTIARITGLDPTLSLWDSNSNRLRASDANYVEVIHTDAGISGISDALGTTDFYPDGGITQQNCDSDSACNHNRAWELFAASVTHNNLVGNLCSSISPSDANCRGFALKMGNNELNKIGTGVYFVETTTDKYPYREISCTCPAIE